VIHSEIAQQLAELIAENQRGATALFETEKALAEAEHDLDTQESKSFLKAQGTVADRQALARLESAQARLQRDLRKAEHNRVKVKIKGIETAIMALATQAKLIQSEAKL
jgi:NADPH-dependent 7-cyano-7-deazaguanine reductase QueF-like protein